VTTEYFTVKHTASKTVYFRVFDPSNSKVFDFDDDTWETNLAACTDPKLAATEKTDPGDADESLYVASYDLATIYNTATPAMFIVQAVDDLATDEVIAEGELWIYAGGGMGGGVGPSITEPTLSVVSDGDGDAVTATVAGDDGVTNTLYYRKPDDTSWTAGEARSGDGDIAQAGLDNHTHYWFVCVASDGDYNSVPSMLVGLFVSSGTVHTYEILAVVPSRDFKHEIELLCVEIDD